jgi:photosystem II stability/assembly factor-like uncharacterized protein
MPKKASSSGVLLLVGTTKGAFVFHSSGARGKWTMSGPYLRGEPVYAMAFDGRAGRRRLWAGTGNPFFGSSLRSSDDLGETWSDKEEHAIKFPATSGLALKQIWQIRPGPASNPDVMYCGVEPSALFESRDAGKTWTVNAGLLGHEHRVKWTPGGGGLCLHTIVPLSDSRIGVAMSTGGFYRSDDGGKSWRARNVGVRAEFLPDKYPEFGQCVHKVVSHPARPERLFLQNHWGLYRSDDWGETWHDIANGVPSDFGFAMAIHPHDPDTAYIVPLESDGFRCVPDAKLRVYRTRDAGKSWKPLARGLPQEGAFESVLRDGLDTDTSDPAGVYFGTRSGKVFASRDEGASWEMVATSLPSVVCVKAAVLAPAPSHAKRKVTAAHGKRKVTAAHGKRTTARRHVRGAH